MKEKIRESKICLFCKRGFFEKNRRIPRFKCCSLKCSSKLRRRPRKRKQCIQCSKHFLARNRPPYSPRPQKFCSRECLYAHLRANAKPPAEIGSNNWGREIRLSLAYHDFRKAAFKKYGRKCAKCGKTKEKYPTLFFDVDHIEPVAVNPKRIFDLSNVRILCRPCHQKTDTWGHRATKLKKARSKLS